MNRKIVSILGGAALAAILTAGCSSRIEVKKREKASEYGEQHAREIIESLPMDEMQLQGKLLEVRSNEHLYRSNGRDGEADAYIAAFSEYMKLHCDTLACTLGME
ncbi:MAG: hypothetical protein NC117_03875 [Pseudoflavonifractor sp.]|nr:hypothetical protein [Pseudoflavonifractor sp.]